MRIRIFDTQKEAGVYAAGLAERVIETKVHPVLGLATGSTAIPFYNALVQFHRDGLKMRHVLTFNLDEYVGLQPQHPQSYHYFMKHHLFAHVDIEQDRIFIPRGDALDLKSECQRYDKLLSAYPIDFQLLGIGKNGHVGFNEPASLLTSQTHVVDLSEDTILSNARFFKEPVEVPRRAITMGIQSILLSKQIVLMAFGREKADIIAQAVNKSIRTDLPASILQLHQNVTLVLDRASGSRLMDGSSPFI